MDLQVAYNELTGSAVVQDEWNMQRVTITSQVTPQTLLNSFFGSINSQ